MNGIFTIKNSSEKTKFEILSRQYFYTTQLKAKISLKI